MDNLTFSHNGIESLKKILSNQLSFSSANKIFPVKIEAEKLPTLVLFDNGLGFIKDYLYKLKHSLNLVFDKLENYDYLLEKSRSERQIDPTKKNHRLQFSGIIVFLKFFPNLSEISLSIVRKLRKKNSNISLVLVLKL